MSNLKVPDNIPANDKLAAMEFVAKMRASADRCGAGFVGGFIAPDGSKFVMTNMSDDDAQALLPDDLK